MPPAAVQKVLTYEVQERVLCFHGPMLYEAKVLEIKRPEDKKEPPEYKVHYKGWKNTWDEFVPADRLRKMNEENLRMQKELNENTKPSANSKVKPAPDAKKKINSKAGSEDLPLSAGGATSLPPRGQKRGRELEIEKVGNSTTTALTSALTTVSLNVPSTTTTITIPARTASRKSVAGNTTTSKQLGRKGGKNDKKHMEDLLMSLNKRLYADHLRGIRIEATQEDDFLKRHDIKINIPDNLKALLVDDWENVTKNQQLVPLPRNPTVTQILQRYRESMPKKREGSADADIFDEVIAGLKLYFDRSLGTILLYRFERQQYQEIRKEHSAKEMSDIYGGEHLLRLFVSMPELLAHTNMDAQSVTKLREHIEDFIRFLAKNPEQCMATPYESGSSSALPSSSNSS
ncbi:Esa1p-associated factor [Rhizina undulata]